MDSDNDDYLNIRNKKSAIYASPSPMDDDHDTTGDYLNLSGDSGHGSKKNTPTPTTSSNHLSPSKGNHLSHTSHQPSSRTIRKSSDSNISSSGSTSNHLDKPKQPQQARALKSSSPPKYNDTQQQQPLSHQRTQVQTPSPVKSNLNVHIKKPIQIQANKDSQFYKTIVNECRFDLDSGSPIRVEDLTFARKHLSSLLSKHKNSANGNVFQKEFLSGLEEFIKVESNLEVSVQPVQLTDSNGNDIDGSSTLYLDSFLKILLSVQTIQYQVMEWVLEILPSFPETFIKNTFSQFRWVDLDTKNDDSLNSLAEKISEFLGLLDGVALKKDCVGFIPDIIGSSTNNNAFVQMLDRMWNEEPMMYVTILDVFSSLQLSPADQMAIREKAFQSLETCKLEDIPVTLTFLIHSITTKEQGVEFVRMARDKLNLQSKTLATSEETFDFLKKNAAHQQQQQHLQELKSSEELIVETLKSEFRFKKDLISIYLKEIIPLDSYEKHKILDIWMLIIFYSFHHNNSKDIELLFKKKILGGQFSKQLLFLSLSGHEVSLKQFFKDMVALCENFLRSSEPRVRTFGMAFYGYLFRLYPDEKLSNNQQILLDSLACHISSSNSNEIDCALEVLNALCDKAVDQMSNHTSMIKGLLEQIESLNEGQIRKLFQIYSKLLYKPVFGSGYKSYDLVENKDIFGELDIFTRKQITHPSPRYKKIGIISLCSRIGRMAAEYVNPQNQLVIDLPEKIFQSIQRDIETLKGNCASSPIATAYYLDELVNTHQHQPFHYRIASQLADLYANEIRAFLGNQLETTKTLWFNIDQEGAGDCCLIYPNVSEFGKNREKMVCLAPQFRLLQFFQRAAKKNSLEDIDSILVTPVEMFEKELLDDSFRLVKDRDNISLSLYYCINYIRELLNGYSTQAQTNIGMIPKLLLRLDNLIELDQLFEKALGQCISFTIPQGTFESDNRKRGFQLEIKKKSPSSTTSTKTSEGKKIVKKKSSASISMVPSGILNVHQEPKLKVIDLDLPHLKLVKPYLRPLDLSAIALLSQYQNGSNNIGFSQVTGELIRLKPEYLLYLLEDFYSKLTILTSHDKTPIGFSHSSNVPKQQLPYNFYDLIKDNGQIFPCFWVHIQRCIETLSKNHQTAMILLGQSKSQYQALKAAQKQENSNTNGSKSKKKSDDEDEMDSTDKSRGSTETMIKQIRSTYEKSIQKLNNLNRDQSILNHCLTIMFKCYEKVFVYGDDSDEHQAPLQRLLNDIAYIRKSYEKSQKPVKSSSGLTLIATELYHQLEMLIPDLIKTSHIQPCLSLLDSMSALCQNSWISNPLPKQPLSRIAKTFISTKWSDVQQKIPPPVILELMNIYLSNSPEPLETIKSTLDFYRKFIENFTKKKSKKGKYDEDDEEEEQEEEEVGDEQSNDDEDEEKEKDKEEERNGILEDTDECTFRMLTPMNQLAFYKSIFGNLVQYCDTVDFYHHDRKWVDRINLAIEIFLKLLNVAQVMKRPLYIVEAMKQGSKFTQLFTKHFLTQYEVLVKKGHTSGTNELLKLFQNCTRKLDELCGDAKLIKEKSITKLVPDVKKTIESFNMETRSILSSLGFSDAFRSRNVIQRRSVKKEMESEDEESEDEDEEEEEKESTSEYEKSENESHRSDQSEEEEFEHSEASEGSVESRSGESEPEGDDLQSDLDSDEQLINLTRSKTKLKKRKLPSDDDDE
ncbi:hypothetical protein DLAC_09001 [Tieghemostelium lacteum]|uniref:Uncharacterized protein n=1 Tax=Tieghemostelium lacteum TaxID=361077 RepID=A0A151Z945_TIELA|nr:hypothetical protein DLAC_09001 [Tieghemostelium lacteum]|eukprot:KYQ90384.1 hypothetical protein DLAC_09001 [Tieghemostelium lacteum]